VSPNFSSYGKIMSHHEEHEETGRKTPIIPFMSLQVLHGERKEGSGRNPSPLVIGDCWWLRSAVNTVSRLWVRYGNSCISYPV
jgi:hypothetical protein